MLPTKTQHEEEEARLLGRWDWITESIDDYDTRLNTAIVLENTYDKMVKEGQVPRDWLERTLNEDTLNEDPNVGTGQVGVNLIPKVMFPLIRRVFPSLIANKLVSVQPLSQPTGVVYYMRYGYDTTKGDITAGNEYSALPQEATPAFSTYFSSEKIGPFTATIAAATNCTAGIGGTAITNFIGTSAPATGAIKRIEVYNAGGVNQTPAQAAAQNTTGIALNQQSDPSYNDVKKTYTVDMYGASRVVGAQYRTTFATGTSVPTTTASFVTAAVSANVYYNYSTGIIYLAGVDTAANNAPWTAGQTVKVFLIYNQEASNLQPQMSFSIGSQTVQTTERKLRVSWTKESEQDMRAFHKIDVEAELVKMASMEMNYEIDREVLTYINDQIDPALSFTHDWTADAATSGNNATGNFLDRHRALAQKLYQVSAKIAAFNRLGPASWAVVSPQAAAVLQMLPDWKGEIAGSGGFTVQEAGKIGGGSIQVFVDPNRNISGSTQDVLLGYKNNNSTYGAGVVYAPYTNWMSNTITDPANFNSIRGFFSRYALTTVNRGQYYYGRVSISNLSI